MFQVNPCGDDCVPRAAPLFDPNWPLQKYVYGEGIDEPLLMIVRNAETGAENVLLLSPEQPWQRGRADELRRHGGRTVRVRCLRQAAVLRRRRQAPFAAAAQFAAGQPVPVHRPPLPGRGGAVQLPRARHTTRPWAASSSPTGWASCPKLRWDGDVGKIGPNEHFPIRICTGM